MPGKTIKGVYYPSVTEIIDSTLSKGPQYEKWLVMKGWKEAKKISSTAAKQGTKIHTVLNKVIKNEKVGAKFKPYEEDFKKYLLNKKVLHAEETIVSERLGFCGTPDLVYETTDGQIVVSDLKNGEPRRHHILQISGYGELLRDSFSYTDIDGELVYTKHGFDPVKVELRSDVFIALLKVYNWNTKNV